MPIIPTPAQRIADAFRERCYGCFRPASECFCAIIPAIENKTEVLILQHMRERFHPFNTARIVHRALQNSRLLVDHTKDLAAKISLQPRAGLLYPGPGATLLADLPADQRPEQLVVLDGTWHHAKTLVRDIPVLHGLPRYQLAPVSPSRYRIRREPDALFLSTVEATVAALRVLEPGTKGLDQLLQAFDHMVERQLAHPKSERSRHHLGRRSHTFKNIPLALLGDLENVVVAYGESAAGKLGCLRDPHVPVYWVAQRLGTGERFASTIRSDSPLPNYLLSHFQLTSDHFASALCLDEARSAWAAFQRPRDTVAVFNQGSARLLRQISPDSHKCFVLKSVDFHPGRRYGTLDEIVAAEGLQVAPALQPGRAGRRLAQITAFVRHLNALWIASARSVSVPEAVDAA
ncbi:MAG: DTW domain-containing protein [Pirellulaceae bacterium]|nr:DTW domain-containing protein [Pirellulaceae bacterium]